MSILIEKITHNTGEGIITGSYPPGEVYNVTLKTSGNNKIIKWNDPEDTIINGTTLSTWYHTILVRKQGSIPESPDDGDLIINNYERNKYSQTEYQDTGLTSGATYYYRFFTFNTEEICNNSGNMIFCEDVTSVSTTLSDNDWETIVDTANKGEGQNYWQVGDEITLQLSGTYNVTCTMQIWDFNHFDKSDGSGKANICFGCKDIYIMEQMNTINSFIGGWVNMPMRNTVMQNIYNSMPYELQNAIKEVTIQYNPGDTSNINTCNDKVFIPSISEVGISSPSSPSLGTAFPIFSDDTSRMKYDMRPNGSGDPDFWWTRSAYEYRTNYFLIVFPNGYYDCYTITDTDGAVFCFNI